MRTTQTSCPEQGRAGTMPRAFNGQVPTAGDVSTSEMTAGRWSRWSAGLCSFPSSARRYNPHPATTARDVASTPAPSQSRAQDRFRCPHQDYPSPGQSQPQVRRRSQGRYLSHALLEPGLLAPSCQSPVNSGLSCYRDKQKRRLLFQPRHHSPGAGLHAGRVQRRISWRLCVRWNVVSGRSA